MKRNAARDIRRPRSRPVPAGSVIRRVIKDLGIQTVIARNQVILDWNKIVDSAVAKHAQAEKLVGSALVIGVDSPVWMNELSALRETLLRKINSKLKPGTPRIQELRFLLRSSLGPEKTASVVPPVPPASEEETREALRILAPVQDDKLKTILARILEKDRALKHTRIESEKSSTE
jgi:hypothetical protein